MSVENEKIKLHFIYLVSILVFMLVIVSTGLWTNQPKFTEFLSNAATMTSLVLGLVAIFYSFISNDGLSKSLGNILLVSDEIRRFKEQISEFTTLAKGINENEGNNLKKLEDASASVTNVVRDLGSTLSAITDRTVLLQETVGLLPGRIDQLESRFEEASKRSTNTPLQETSATFNHWTVEDIQQFLDRSSLNANLFTYACCIAYRKKVEISSIQVAKVLGTNNKSFLNGFFWSMFACGLLTRSGVLEKDSVYIIKSINSALVEANVKKYFVDYIKINYSEGEREMWLERMSAVESAF